MNIWSLILLLFAQTEVFGTGSYQLEIIAKTGDQTAAGNTIANLGTGPSINDWGQVAYTLEVADGRQGVYVSGENSARSALIESFPVGWVTVGGLSRNFHFGNVLQINNQNQVAWRVWSRDGLFSFIFRLGSYAGDFRIVANTQYERIDHSLLDMPSPFFGLFPFPTKGLYPWITLNNSGRTVFSGLLEGVETVLATPRNPETSGLTRYNDYYFSVSESGHPDLFPVVTDNDYTLVRAGGESSDPLILFDSPQFNAYWPIAESPDFTSIGAKSGISDDSILIAFSGISSSTGIGIYGDAGAGVFKIAGIGGDGHCDPGEACTDSNSNGRIDPGEDRGQFAAFYPEARVAVNGSGYGNPESYTIVFLASRKGNGLADQGPLGLYTVKVDVSDREFPHISEPQLAVEVGQSVEGVPGTVDNLALYDPLNSRGELVFWIQSHSYQAIVRATPDSDGDGLLDPWESEGGGIDIDEDGVPDYDLYALGARPDHKDIFIEVDMMNTMAIPQDSRQRLQEAFAHAPVDNPDATTGIDLHILIDDTSMPHVRAWPVTGDWPEQFYDYKSRYFGTKAERDSGDPRVLAAKKRAFRYCILCDKLSDGVPGKGAIGGSDFVIAAGNPIFNNGYRDSECLASVFMHELGHSLGLRHGGQDDTKAKPNYISVMNPILSEPMQAWSDKFWRLDYSRGGLNDLDESRLDETIGIVDTFGLYPNFKMPYGVNVTDANGQTKRVIKYATIGNGICVDWNWDGQCAGTTSQDLNYYPAGQGDLSTPSPNQVMRCYSDWDNLVYRIKTYDN